MNPPRLSILHLDTAPDFRGGQQALLTLARGLRGRGHQQQIATPTGSELEQRARSLGFSTLPASARAVREALRHPADTVQIVHAHTGQAQNLAFLAAAGIGSGEAPLKRIVTRHVAFAAKHPLVHRLKYTRTCDGVIAVSRAARDAMIRSGVPGERIEIIATGVEVPALPDPLERETARRHWGLAPHDFAAGHLGAFTAEKGQDVAVEAARLLEHRLPELRLILAGEGPLRASLSAAPNLILPGRIDDPASLLAALDVFVMPSRSEAWGLAALEAMAFGLPVIASHTGGLAEMIDPGETGWLVPPGDAAALAEALIEAAGDREKLARMGGLARTGAARFSVEETARRTEEFYLRILNSPVS